MEGAEEHGREAQEKPQSIYKAARAIKRRQNTLYNALRSIYEDSIFVGEISQLWPRLPVLANLRCGLWYSPTFDATCYFKSTDGHCNNWSFNTSRLNLHAALLAGQKGGCIIVDSTRKGKRFPDSMSKTIPIWTCVLNRAIQNYRKLHDEYAFRDATVNLETCNADTETVKPASPPWDSSLHLPLWVSKTEKSSIENCLEEWTRDLESSGADIASLSKSLRKPLRPLWISQKSIIWLNEVPDHDSWDFTPIILLSASSSSGFSQQRTSSEFSWNYIPGAGDDEESWARGLSPSLYWRNSYDLLNMSPDSCNQKVAEIVEKDRVYRAQRGEDAPQIGIKSPLDSSSQDCNCEAMLCSRLPRIGIQGDLGNGEDHSISWIGSTNVAVGTTIHAASEVEVDCILNCDKELLAVGSPYTYLHLPTVNSKFDRLSLLSNLPSAVLFAKTNLSQGKTLLVCCHDGEDISICVCLAILISMFDELGSYDDARYFKRSNITKLEMRKQLVYICQFATGARPSRGNLKQVFNFVNGGRVVNS